MTHAFYPLVGVCRAPAYAARGRGQGLWCDGRRRELRPVNRRKGGCHPLRVIGSDVGLLWLGQRARGPS